MIVGIGPPSSVSHDNNIPSRIRVDLTLLNIFQDVKTDDEQANKLLQILNDKIIPLAIPADRVLEGSDSCSDNEKESVRDEVLRYLQTKDKYAALTSVLLKSQAFHAVHSSSEQSATTIGTSRAIVGLPRTQYKKPYIPTPKRNYPNLQNLKENEESRYPFSISHQHPFVGLAQLGPKTNEHLERQPLLVGMDIVTFDDYNPNLYANQDEFLQVFQDYFSHREWSLIQAAAQSQASTGSSSNDTRLQEFYIRWSMKEAYTKALGVGLGADFSSFDLLLAGDTNEDLEWDATRGQRSLSRQGIYWEMMSKSVMRNPAVASPYPRVGQKHDLKGNKLPESWNFFFLPLWENHLDATSSEVADDPIGCSCVCVGPFSSLTQPIPPVDLTIHWTNLSSRIHWHQLPS